MSLYPKYDVSFWNSDGLEISKYFNKEGIIKQIRIPSFIKKADYISFCPNGFIFLFSRLDRKIFLLNHSTGEFLSAYELKDDMDWLSVKIDKNNLYALDRKRQIDQLSFNEKLMRFDYIRSYKFKCEKLRENSDIVIVELKKQHPLFYKESISVKTCIIGPIENSKFLEVYLNNNDYEGQTEIRIPAPKERPGITLNNCSLAFDDKNYSLIIAEREQNVIIEFYLGRGYSSFICGGKAFREEEGCSAKEACLKNPNDIALYRPAKYIKKPALEKSSQNILDIDKDGIRPRYIYFCDNDKIKKILDFPESARALKLSGLYRVYTLIGYVDQIEANSTAGEALLTSYVLKRPYSLSISDKGEICFLANDNIYLLRPASFFAEEEFYKIAGENESDAS
ncbi:MAG TPA: hypothetical protein VHT96_02220 [Clostridia bacterium]|nr:hypothetical protein [Clostridia bacterium]